MYKTCFLNNFSIGSSVYDRDKELSCETWRGRIGRPYWAWESSLETGWDPEHWQYHWAISPHLCSSSPEAPHLQPVCYRVHKVRLIASWVIRSCILIGNFFYQLNTSALIKTYIKFTNMIVLGFRNGSLQTLSSNIRFARTKSAKDIGIRVSLSFIRLLMKLQLILQENVTWLCTRFLHFEDINSVIFH